MLAEDRTLAFVYVSHTMLFSQLPPWQGDTRNQACRPDPEVHHTFYFAGRAGDGGSTSRFFHLARVSWTLGDRDQEKEENGSSR